MRGPYDCPDVFFPAEKGLEAKLKWIFIEEGIHFEDMNERDCVMARIINAVREVP